MRKQKQEEYSGFRGAGIRLTEAEDRRMLASHSSAYEANTLYAVHAFDKAHLVMMAEENIIPRKDAASMLKALREMEKEGVEKVRVEVGYGLHSGEQYLIRKLGEEVGGRIHLARSSGDLVEVGHRIRIRGDWLKIMGEVNKLRGSILDVAQKHLETVMPGYTHGQHAQPTTLAHYLAAYATTLERDFQRLEETYHRINMSPAGAAIFTGSTFPLNRHREAELLGFEKTLRNTNDAILSRDWLLEVFSVLALLYHNMSRWAIDLQLWCSNEFGMIDIPDRFCVSSSIMMQKKNPWIFENIKGAAAHTIGGLMMMFLAFKGATGLPIADRRYAMDALWASINYVVRDLELLSELFLEMKVNKDLMKERAGSFWAQATDVGSALVREKGLPWRTAHQIVGILVRHCHERGLEPSDANTKLLDEAAIEYRGEPVDLGEESLGKALDPAECVKGRTLYGGTAPDEVFEQIKVLIETMNQDMKIVSKMRSQIKKASENLEGAINAILSA